MKYILTFSLLLMFIVNASAQMTISNPPSIGDSYVIRYCDTNSVSQGNGGANQTWNFSSINLLNDSTAIEWVTSSGTPYASSYPNSDRAQKTNDNYSYYSVQSGDLTYYGTGSATASEVLTNTYPHMKYPFTFGNSYSDNFAGSIVTTGLTFERRGTINVNADGWGTINLPAGSFGNSVRVHTTLDITDSLGGAFPIVVKTLTNTYQWYIPEKKYPVFSITTIAITTIAGTTVTKQVYYSPNQTVGITQISTNIPDGFELSQNYPNPFNPETKINFSLPENSDVVLQIFDMSGKEVETLMNGKLPAGVYEAVWDASRFSTGAYFYRLTANGYVTSKKMLLVK